MLSGVMFLGGATIAQQATVLSNTIKSQLVNVKAFLEKNGVDTSYFDFGKGRRRGFVDAGDAGPAPTHNLAERRRARLERWRDRRPDLQVLARHRQRGRQFLHRVVSGAGLRRAAERLPRRAVVHGAGKASARATIIVDRIGDTLERWLIAQIITMAAVFFVTWIGLAIIGIQSSFILGIQAGLLAFIPTVGAIIGGLIVVLASLASGWIAA